MRTAVAVPVAAKRRMLEYAPAGGVDFNRAELGRLGYVFERRTTQYFLYLLRRCRACDIYVAAGKIKQRVSHHAANGIKTHSRLFKKAGEFAEPIYR
ncbi:hypothetical protein SDC9_204061 [bioreactor metagenome]|uniref:Uncharacterized protein n=1 Tax=bioreactor metagenome TaxID=1076179 RepID=A0A645JA27_9ZZZZ